MHSSSATSGPSLSARPPSAPTNHGSSTSNPSSSAAALLSSSRRSAAGGRRSVGGGAAAFPHSAAAAAYDMTVGAWQGQWSTDIGAIASVSDYAVARYFVGANRIDIVECKNLAASPSTAVRCSTAASVDDPTAFSAATVGLGGSAAASDAQYGGDSAESAAERAYLAGAGTLSVHVAEVGSLSLAQCGLRQSQKLLSIHTFTIDAPTTLAQTEAAAPAPSEHEQSTVDASSSGATNPKHQQQERRGYFNENPDVVPAGTYLLCLLREDPSHYLVLHVSPSSTLSLVGRGRFGDGQRDFSTTMRLGEEGEAADGASTAAANEEGPFRPTHVAIFGYPRPHYGLAYSADSGGYAVLSLVNLVLGAARGLRRQYPTAYLPPTVDAALAASDAEAARHLSARGLGGEGEESSNEPNTNSNAEEPSYTSNVRTAIIIQRGAFAAEWSDVMWKGSPHRYSTRQKFFCYSAVSGACAFECVRVDRRFVLIAEGEAASFPMRGDAGMLSSDGGADGEDDEGPPQAAAKGGDSVATAAVDAQQLSQSDMGDTALTVGDNEVGASPPSAAVPTSTGVPTSSTAPSDRSLAIRMAAHRRSIMLVGPDSLAPRRRGCLLIPVSLNKEVGCLLYSHNYLSVPHSGRSTGVVPRIGFPSLSARRAKGGGGFGPIDGATAMLQKRIFAHGEPWTSCVFLTNTNASSSSNSSHRSTTAAAGNDNGFSASVADGGSGRSTSSPPSPPTTNANSAASAAASARSFLMSYSATSGAVWISQVYQIPPQPSSRGASQRGGVAAAARQRAPDVALPTIGSASLSSAAPHPPHAFAGGGMGGPLAASTSSYSNAPPHASGSSLGHYGSLNSTLNSTYNGTIGNTNNTNPQAMAALMGRSHGGGGVATLLPSLAPSPINRSYGGAASPMGHSGSGVYGGATALPYGLAGPNSNNGGGGGGGGGGPSGGTSRSGSANARGSQNAQRRASPLSTGGKGRRSPLSRGGSSNKKKSPRGGTGEGGGGVLAADRGSGGRGSDAGGLGRPGSGRARLEEWRRSPTSPQRTGRDVYIYDEARDELGAPYAVSSRFCSSDGLEAFSTSTHNTKGTAMMAMGGPHGSGGPLYPPHHSYGYGRSGVASGAGGPYASPHAFGASPTAQHYMYLEQQQQQQQRYNRNAATNNRGGDGVAAVGSVNDAAANGLPPLAVRPGSGGGPANGHDTAHQQPREEGGSATAAAADDDQFAGGDASVTNTLSTTMGEGTLRGAAEEEEAAEAPPARAADAATSATIAADEEDDSDRPAPIKVSLAGFFDTFSGGGGGATHMTIPAAGGGSSTGAGGGGAPTFKAFAAVTDSEEVTQMFADRRRAQRKRGSYVSADENDEATAAGGGGGEAAGSPKNGSSAAGQRRGHHTRGASSSNRRGTADGDRGAAFEKKLGRTPQPPPRPDRSSSSRRRKGETERAQSARGADRQQSPTRRRPATSAYRPDDGSNSHYSNQHFGQTIPTKARGPRLHSGARSPHHHDGENGGGGRRLYTPPRSPRHKPRAPPTASSSDANYDEHGRRKPSPRRRKLQGNSDGDEGDEEDEDDPHAAAAKRRQQMYGYKIPTRPRSGRRTVPEVVEEDAAANDEGADGSSSKRFHRRLKMATPRFTNSSSSQSQSTAHAAAAGGEDDDDANKDEAMNTTVPIAVKGASTPMFTGGPGSPTARRLGGLPPTTDNFHDDITAIVKFMQESGQIPSMHRKAIELALEKVYDMEEGDDDGGLMERPEYAHAGVIIATPFRNVRPTTAGHLSMASAPDRHSEMAKFERKYAKQRAKERETLVFTEKKMEQLHNPLHKRLEFQEAQIKKMLAPHQKIQRITKQTYENIDPTKPEAPVNIKKQVERLAEGDIKIRQANLENKIKKYEKEAMREVKAPPKKLEGAAFEGHVTRMYEESVRIRQQTMDKLIRTRDRGEAKAMVGAEQKPLTAADEKRLAERLIGQSLLRREAEREAVLKEMDKPIEERRIGRDREAPLSMEEAAAVGSRLWANEKPYAHPDVAGTFTAAARQ